jgi:ATP phosphoribosyltransferase
VAELGFARCTLEAAVPVDAGPTCLADLEGLRVATAYPVSTRASLEQLGVSVELVTISGAVEAAPRLGLADAIVDLVSTGSTASVNGLRLIGQLLESQAVLLRGPRSAGEKDELVERLALMLEAVVAARRRRYVMMNAPAAALEEIRAVLPSMGAPSVLELAEPGQIAIHAAIEADRVWDLLGPLKAAGATSILVVPVERLVP